MPGTLLIPIENGRGVKTYGVNYCCKLCIMKSTPFYLIVILSAFHFHHVRAEFEFYPGFRRPDSILKWDKDQFSEDFTLEQIRNTLLEQEQQRRLALQQEAEPEFTFRLPARPLNTDDDEFAIAPPDPRYYQTAAEDEDFLDGYGQDDEEKLDEEEEEEMVAEQPVLKGRSEEPRPDTTVRYLREQELSRAQSGLHHHADQTVDVVPVKAPVQDETAEVYIIAVVAGISAAATVGLIAFAIGWYNLQKNVKNASDVEYPAYGVTGPNKDVSPTGDRRLAQSAQMYHYQHQKQQIIAMESRAAATVRHGSMSEAESDEENEEGDYTVYECPGLAPTGEMEVKNPLFQDEPTPAAVTNVPGEEAVPDQK